MNRSEHGQPDGMAALLRSRNVSLHHMLAFEPPAQAACDVACVSRMEIRQSPGMMPPMHDGGGEATRWECPGFDREVVARVWQFAQVVAGNDPELWRKDECGAWLYRLDYGSRSTFGWEIFDGSLGRGHGGIAALRPLQWQNYLDQMAAETQSRVTADGLRNVRRLL